jgi:hypothetical protein
VAIPQKPQALEKQPNAYKSALRIATALSRVSPEWDNKSTRWIYRVNTPRDVVVNDIISGLLSAAVLTVNNHELANSNSARQPSLNQDKSPLYDTLTFTLPANRRDIAAHNHNTNAQPRIFPVHTIAKQLNTMLEQLSNNWEQDRDGNYRHTQVFKNFRRYGFKPELFWYSLPSDLQKSESIRLYNSYNDQGELQSPPIAELPVSPQHHFAHSIGVCLNPEQVGYLAAQIGFPNPARPRSPIR